MKSTPSPAKSSILKAIFALGTTAAVIIFLWWYTGHRKGPETSNNTPTTRLTTREKAAFFDENVAPILGANASANAKALETLKSDIHAQFEQYRRRVPSFTSDITGIGNKSKITWEALKQMTSDDKKKVERHVTEKFEMHVVSAMKMQSDLEALLKGFRRDIEANRNHMLVDIQAAVKTDPRLLAARVKLPESFVKETEASISKASVQAGKDGVVLSNWTLIASFASEEAVRNLVIYALTEMGESLAASMGITAVTSGGASVAGGVGGGAGGTVIEPGLGTAIGAGAGLVVGLAVDWVMSARMESKLNEECTKFLTSAEFDLTRKSDGLIDSISKALAELDRIQYPVIKHQIEELP